MPNILSIILGIVFFPITLLGSWIVVNPQEEKIVLFWGKLNKVLKNEGLYFFILWGRNVITISTKKRAMELHKTTVADKNGNPIIIAAVCTYQVKDTVKAALNIENYESYIKTLAMAVLKQVASKYPYESPDSHCLKTEASVISTEMVDVLQKKMETAGISVISFELSDLSYAPEIAQSMLIRQQAQALVDARKIVVEGAVEIVNDALQRLDEKSVKIPDSVKPKIVGNLLAIICAESRVQPTYSIQQEGENSDFLMKKMLLTLEEINRKTKSL
jgi:regulator of protease activity HflC (stomatin/prohibitin superfamily)